MHQAFVRSKRKGLTTEHQHTPLSPHKNRVRRDMLSSCSKNKDIITISHALLDTLMILEWAGRIMACDIDLNVRIAIDQLRRSCAASMWKDKYDGGDYPELNILPPAGDVRDAVRHYIANHGVSNLGIVDVDLASGIQKCWDILEEVLVTLQTHKYQGYTFLTFVNGRDRAGFGKYGSGSWDRIDWLRARLPTEVKYISHTLYNSVRLDNRARRSRGSCMCIVKLKHS